MLAAYGIIVQGKVQDGKWDEMRVAANGHFIRQLDGREPGATCATIIEPTKEDPNTFYFFEQWKSKADYDAHSAPNDNLKFFSGQAGQLFDGEPKITQTGMRHFEKSANGGRKYGILVKGKAKAGKLEDLLAVIEGHFVRQHDGRELGATCAAILEPNKEEPDVVQLFEQFETKRDYEAHSKPNANLKVFMEQAGDLWGDVEVKQYAMHHYERSLPGVAGPPTGAVEMKVTTKKNQGFYVKAAQSFFTGVEARPASEGREATEAKPAVEHLRISGLGEAVDVAVRAAAEIESEGLGKIVRTQTAYPPMDGHGRGCAQIVIDLKKA